MNKYQISILAIAFSFLSLVLPNFLFIISGVLVGIFLLWMMRKELVSTQIKYEPYVFITLTLFSILLCIIIFSHPAIAWFNFIFFSIACFMSLKYKKDNEPPLVKEEEIEETPVSEPLDEGKDEVPEGSK